MKKFFPLIAIGLLIFNKNISAQCTSGDCQNGWGILISDGGRYEGYFAGGLKNGQGTFNWTDGDKYVGEWLNGWRTGYGIYYWPNGDSYEGYFKQNSLNGYGTKYWANGDTYTGNWVDSKQDGYGVVTIGPDRHIKFCDNCATYKGNWVADVKSGFGRCYDKDGKLIYEGNFLDNKPVDSYPNRF